MTTVVLDLTDEKSLNPEYVKLIETDEPVYVDVYYWYGITKKGKEYRLNTTNNSGGEKEPKFKNENKPLILGEWGKIRREQLKIKGTKWKSTESQSIELLSELGIWPFAEFKYIKEPKQYKEWDIRNDLKNKDMMAQFYAIIIDSGKIIGRCISNIVQLNSDNDPGIPEFLKNEDTEYIYISRVDIHPLYRGLKKKKCEPLVTSMIETILSKIKYKLKKNFLIFIDNASITGNGIFACKCYTRAGVNNELNVFYTEDNSLLPMDVSLCTGDLNMPRKYYYESLSPKNKSPSHKSHKSHKTPKNKSPSPKSKSPSPKSKSLSPKSKSLSPKSPKNKSLSPKSPKSKSPSPKNKSQKSRKNIKYNK